MVGAVQATEVNNIEFLQPGQKKNYDSFNQSLSSNGDLNKFYQDSGINALNAGNTKMTDPQAVEKLYSKFGKEIEAGFTKGSQDPSQAKAFIQEALNLGRQFQYPNPAMFAGGLLQLIKLECAFNPVEKNSEGYQGLIQFSPSNFAKYKPSSNPIAQLKGAVKNYLTDNRNALKPEVKQADIKENGKRLLVSVFTGPGSSSLNSPASSTKSDSYGTSVSSYNANIEKGQKAAS